MTAYTSIVAPNRRKGFVCVAAIVAAMASSASVTAQELQKLSVPLECAGGSCTMWVSSYVDRDTSSGSIQDWKCGSNTRDGHKGTDLVVSTGNYVVAAAGGTVVKVQTGKVDNPENGPCPPDWGTGLDAYGNYVYIDHGDYLALYAHLQQGSITVSEGQTVSCKDRLGRIGNSGNSCGTHLHFELNPPGSSVSASPSRTVYDPYSGGACSMGFKGLWTVQVEAGSSVLEPAPGAVCDTGSSDGCYGYPEDRWVCDVWSSSLVRCISGELVGKPCTYGCEDTLESAECYATAPAGAEDYGYCAQNDCSFEPGSTDLAQEGGEVSTPAVKSRQSGTVTPGCDATSDPSAAVFFMPLLALWLFCRRRRSLG